MSRHCVLTLCPDIVSIHYVHTLCPNIVSLHCVPTLCPDIVSQQCVPILCPDIVSQHCVPTLFPNIVSRVSRVWHATYRCWPCFFSSLDVIGLYWRYVNHGCNWASLVVHTLQMLLTYTVNHCIQSRIWTRIWTLLIIHLSFKTCHWLL